jgi:hypothetical protein
MENSDSNAARFFLGFHCGKVLQVAGMHLDHV